MDKEDILENCPHCGTRMSPWQKVLLKVDRAIRCKKCWYRIILEPKPMENSKQNKNELEKKIEKRGSNGNV